MLWFVSRFFLCNLQVTVDRSLNESSGNRSRGSRGRGRSTTSWLPKNSSGYANNEHGPVKAYVKKSSQVSNVDRKSQEEGIGSTKQPDEVAALKISGDNKDHLKSSASSSSKNMNLSGDSFFSRECEDKDVKDAARMRCDLMNQMKDVSLSCLESVSSTSDQKVEHSSVEDHDSAFDIVLKKKVVGVKPSLLELNREKRKATKGYTGIVIRPGMVLLKNYLSIDDQVSTLSPCFPLSACVCASV